MGIIKITLKTSKGDLDKAKADFISRINRVTMSEITAVGLEIITQARQKQGHDEYQGQINGATKLAGGSIDLATGVGFNDQTGNLRASIGYIVLHNGVQVAEDFTGVSDGIEAGRTYAAGQGADYPRGFVLIIVAGMEYATYVEDLGYDVISGSTMLAGKLMSQVQSNVERAFS